MKKVFQIEIEEILQKVVEVEANSLDEAFDIVQNRYKREEYILGADDFTGVEFKEFRK